MDRKKFDDLDWSKLQLLGQAAEIVWEKEEAERNERKKKLMSRKYVFKK